MTVQPNRNSLCLCGSGKKFKECCGRLDASAITTSNDRGSANVSMQSLINHLAALSRESRFAEAEKVALIILNQQPNAGLVWQTLAIALSGQGKEALHAFERAAQLLPGSVNAHVNLGIILMDGGKIEAAMNSFQRALAINPDSVDALNHIAVALLGVGKYQEAAICYQRVVLLKPELAESHRNFANALLQLGRCQDAINSYQRTLELAPDDFEANFNMANAFKAVQKPEDALHWFRRSVVIQPDSIVAHARLATILRLQAKADEAEQHCREVLARFPNSAILQAVLGQVLADQGRFMEAEDLFKTAIDNDPQSLEAWDGIAHMRKMTVDDAPLWDLAERIAVQLTSPERELFLRYAIAKYYDDIRNYEVAFYNYHRANELIKLIRPPHNQQELTRSGDSIIRTYNRSWSEQHRNRNNDTSKPVFVVGMMRSGTTLAEQILASHPAVYGAGESGFWGTAFGHYDSARHEGQSANQAIAKLTEEYAALLNRISGHPNRVVDKTPMNFVYLGFINAVLPNARIIHMMRNPIDTCLSIYFQNFSETITYANDLEDLAHCYREYIRIMNHWRSILPAGSMLEVPYEALVEDTETWSRRMIEFIGLDWHEDCLQFYKTNRAVVTASKWQVRQKIYKSSMERWRNYEKFIEPLLSLIE